MYQNNILLFPSLHVCGDVFCFFVCVFLHCNEQVAWMKCSLSSGVMQLYFFLLLLIRVINRVDSGIIERKGKNEIHGNMNANCSLQSLPFEGHNITCNRYLRCEESIIFSTWTKHLFINISCKLKETACYTVVVPQWHVTNVWIQTGHPY